MDQIRHGQIYGTNNKYNMNQPPTLRPDLPNYPPGMQLIRVTTTRVPGPGGSLGSSSAGATIFPFLYVGSTQQLNPQTLLVRDREPCLVVDMRAPGTTGLTAGYYFGRLSGNFNGLPLYEVYDPIQSGTSNNLTVRNVGNTFSQSNVNILMFNQESDGFTLTATPNFPSGFTVQIGMNHFIGVRHIGALLPTFITHTIEFDQNDGFFLSQTTGTTDTGTSQSPIAMSLGIRDASTTQAGIVNTGAQTFSQDKTFRENIYIAGVLGNATLSFASVGGETGYVSVTGVGATGQINLSCTLGGGGFGLVGDTGGTLYLDWNVRGIIEINGVSGVHSDGTDTGGLQFEGGVFVGGVIDLSYTAAEPTDWAGTNPPDDLISAIDRIAAALTILGQPP